MEFSSPDFRQPPIDAYGDGGFRVDGKRVKGSILLLPQRMDPWEVTAPEEITSASLGPLIAVKDSFDILLIGCGAEMAFPPKDVRAFLDEHGIAWDAMTTSAACRTYNVLASEDRPVAGALIAVD
ncbi:Mth938-like domain-containing protein [Tepidicaulis sp. LMO-SS28]|uniref:Mth938-like domain-containing protein n=1 Tax=Tepidicaulis sp. LMO-SS28 TaxID=3447455 RepID=UPI003EDF5F69